MTTNVKATLLLSILTLLAISAFMMLSSSPSQTTKINPALPVSAGNTDNENKNSDLGAEDVSAFTFSDSDNQKSEIINSSESTSQLKITMSHDEFAIFEHYHHLDDSPPTSNTDEKKKNKNTINRKNTSCTDDDVLRGFFGCQCGNSILSSEHIFGPCLFGHAQRIPRNLSLTRKENDERVAKKFECQDSKYRIAILGDSTSFGTFVKKSNVTSKHNTLLNNFINQQDNTDDKIASRKKKQRKNFVDFHFNGGMVKQMSTLRHFSLNRKCREDEEMGSRRAVTLIYWENFVVGHNLMLFGSNRGSVENFTKSSAFSNAKNYRPHIAIIMLGALDAESILRKQQQQQQQIQDIKIFYSSIREVLYKKYYDLIDDLITEATVRRIILVTPPPAPPPSIKNNNNFLLEKKLSDAYNKILQKVIAPIIRRIASNKDLNAKLALGSSQTASMILVDLLRHFSSPDYSDEDKRTLYADVGEFDEKLNQQEPDVRRRRHSGFYVSPHLHLSTKGQSVLAALLHRTVCRKCTTEILPRLPFDFLEINNTGTMEVSRRMITSHEIYSSTSAISTICPPGSTADSIWGFNDVDFNSNDFHLLFNRKLSKYDKNNNNNDTSDDKKTATERFGNFGTWITSNDQMEGKAVKDSERINRRAEMLRLLCRQRIVGGNAKLIQQLMQNAIHERKHLQRMTHFESESSFLLVNVSNFIQDHSACEWYNKPYGWTPFQGPWSFSLKEAAAIFLPSSIIMSSFSATESSGQTIITVSPNSSLLPQFPIKNLQLHRKTPSASLPRSWCYDFQDPVACLYGKTVLFIGDSHVLNMAQITCRMLLRDPLNALDTRKFSGLCGELDLRFTRPISATYIPETKTTIAMFRLRYNISNQMKRFHRHPWSKRILLNADFVFITRGMWDVVYRDSPKRVIFDEFYSTLMFLTETFKKARIIVKILHYDHKAVFGCATHERQRDVRDATICSMHRASKSMAEKILSIDEKDNNNSSSEESASFRKKQIAWSKFSIFDTFGMTRQLPYAEASDLLGHHYQGALQESMVQMMLSLMCPPQPQNYEAIFQHRDKAAEISCSRVLDPAVSPPETRRPMCACTNFEFYFPRGSAAYNFCARLRSVNLVPFVTDN